MCAWKVVMCVYVHIRDQKNFISYVYFQLYIGIESHHKYTEASEL